MSWISARLCALACMATLLFSAPASAELIYGIAAVGNSTALLNFDSATPGSIDGSVFVSGLQSNESILGIDFRPKTGQLYALGSTNRLYTLDPATGVATAVNGPFAPVLNGFSFGFDFNPEIDMIRVVAETDRNFVLDPDTGLVSVSATNLAYGPADPNFGVNPNVVHSAYSNNVPNAMVTQLYGIDAGLDILVTQANNLGTLGTVGPLGVDATSIGGFDISGTSGIAYAALVPAGSPLSNLYSINLLTGAATLVGQIDGGLIITALTVAPVIPEPASVVLFGSSLLAFVAFRRRKR